MGRALQWFQGFLTAGPDGRADPFHMVAAGDWVASKHLGRFTHTGPLQAPAGEIPPTGRRAELQIAEVYQMKDGKLALLRANYDVATMLRQLGLMS
jgi:predicted ester cyclase